MFNLILIFQDFFLITTVAQAWALVLLIVYTWTTAKNWNNVGFLNFYCICHKTTLTSYPRCWINLRSFKLRRIDWRWICPTTGADGGKQFWRICWCSCSGPNEKKKKKTKPLRTSKRAKQTINSRSTENQEETNTGKVSAMKLQKKENGEFTVRSIVFIVRLVAIKWQGTCCGNTVLKQRFQKQ